MNLARTFIFEPPQRSFPLALEIILLPMTLQRGKGPAKFVAVTPFREQTLVFLAEKV